MRELGVPFFAGDGLPWKIDVKLATVVVAFHPGRDVMDKIVGYAKYMEFLIVTDNTDGEDLRDFFDLQPKLEYFYLIHNQGLAKALNVAAERAIDLGYEWLLMLDQDSLLSEPAYSTLRQQIEIHSAPDMGIISANPISSATRRRQDTSRLATVELDRIMTSGSVLNLDAYRQCGRFEDALFIDHVDHEYCLRLQKRGYRTIQCSNIVLGHTLGEVHQLTVFGWVVTYVDHKPFRLYYFVRNGLSVGATYFWYRPQFLWWVLHQIIRHLIKALLFQDQKLLRIRMFYWGFKDYILGRYGPGRSIHDGFPH